jgi:hypothetical protein
VRKAIAYKQKKQEFMDKTRGMTKAGIKNFLADEKKRKREERQQGARKARKKTSRVFYYYHYY